MTRLTDVKSHRIFRVEQRGRALVVTPMGDSPGFGNADFKVERERVMSLLADGREAVIVDFGEANYFGSEMIGVVSRMLAAVRERSGTYAVVNVSDDMRKGLAIMKLDERWNLMDERTALRDVAKETAFSTIHRFRKPLLLVFASLLLVGGAVFAYLSIDRSQDVSDYETLLGMWENLRIKRNRPGFDLELQSWKRKQVETLEPMIERWEQEGPDQDPLRTIFLTASREHLVKILDPYTRIREQKSERYFLDEMEKARKLIEAQDHVNLSRPTNLHRGVQGSQTTPGPAGSHEAPAAVGGHDAPSPWTSDPPAESPNDRPADPPTGTPGEHDAERPPVDPTAPVDPDGPAPEEIDKAPPAIEPPSSKEEPSKDEAPEDPPAPDAAPIPDTPAPADERPVGPPQVGDEPSE